MVKLPASSLQLRPPERVLVGDDGKFLSPNIVALEECRLKREEEVQVGDEDKGTLRSVSYTHLTLPTKA